MSQEINIDDISADNMLLDFVKQYLRIDHDFDDLEIMVHIRAAQNYVRNYTHTEPDEPLDDGLIIPILMLVSYFYENKSINMKSTEKLDVMFGSMLQMHRKNIIGEF